MFCTLTAALAVWEWGALMALGGVLRFSLGITLIFICAAVAALEPAALGLEPGFNEAAWRLGRWFYLPAAVFWLLVVPLWMRYHWPSLTQI